MVLRAKPDGIVPEFLPFFMQSDVFFDRALAISVGSLSPTINWSALARQQFAIPTFEYQGITVELLQSAEVAIDAAIAALRDAEIARTAMLSHCFASRPVAYCILSEAGKWLSGSTPSRGRNEFWDGQFPWASPKDMKSDVLLDAEEHISEKAIANGASVAPKDAILITVRGMILAHSFPIAIAGVPIAFNQDLKAVIASDDFDAKYLFYWLKANTSRILHLVSDSSHGTKRLPLDEFLRLEVRRPTLDAQRRVVSVLEDADNGIEKLRCNIDKLKQVKRAVLNRLLTGQSA